MYFEYLKGWFFGWIIQAPCFFPSCFLMSAFGPFHCSLTPPSLWVRGWGERFNQIPSVPWIKERTEVISRKLNLGNTYEVQLSWLVLSLFLWATENFLIYILFNLLQIFSKNQSSWAWVSKSHQPRLHSLLHFHQVWGLRPWQVIWPFWFCFLYKMHNLNILWKIRRHFNSSLKGLRYIRAQKMSETTYLSFLFCLRRKKKKFNILLAFTLLSFKKKLRIRLYF